MEYDMQEELVRWLTSVWTFEIHTICEDVNGNTLFTLIDGKRFIFKGRV